jgi:group I intron endonuclease
MKTTGIYLIRNLKNGKVYVGSAVDIKRRRGLHLNRLDHGNHENAHLQNAWNKYGPEAFEWKILLECDVDDLLYYEQKAFVIYKISVGWENMYNICPTAGNRLGSVTSAETRAKQSAIRMGRPAWNKGIKASDAVRIKMSISKKGKAPPNKGRKGQIPWNKGKTYSAELCKKLSKSHAGKPWTQAQRDARKKR